MKISLKCSLVALLIIGALSIQAQDVPENWFNLSPAESGLPGIGTEKTYQELLGNRKSQTVIVAVVDSGVDPDHEDLKDLMWTNPGEIPGNGKDDDGNGYIDDVHGWNFIGNPNGENVHYDNLEGTRLYAKYKEKYEDVDPDAKLSQKEREEYKLYKKLKKEIEAKREELKPDAQLYITIADAFNSLQQAIGKEDITQEDIDNFQTPDPFLQRTAMVVTKLLEQGESFKTTNEEIQMIAAYYDSRYNYNYNPDYDGRSLVGDNYEDPTERYYGNNDVEGTDADHGTHVAGIIGAARGNDIGIDGIADNVRIMAVRVVPPEGDERDKDVANAIRYAVDNGASVINMSFGKGYSPYKSAVDEALRYAEKNDVLLVHAAGNDGAFNDNETHFPVDRLDRKGLFQKLFGKKQVGNWIEVGALSWEGGENLPASFSNYGAESVDVFAPGVAIYSTVPNDQYANHDGTSMAAPVVSGMAAVLRSYFPELTAEQVKEVILRSADKQKGKVVKPGSGEKVPFSELCLTGGTVDLYDAVELAVQTKGKKKVSGVGGEAGSSKENDKKAVVVP